MIAATANLSELDLILHLHPALKNVSHSFFKHGA